MNLKTIFYQAGNEQHEDSDDVIFLEQLAASLLQACM
jgi:hypothetical protein